MADAMIRIFLLSALVLRIAAGLWRYSHPKNPQRELSHLRKNNMFALVQIGEQGIPKRSTAIHNIRLIKDDSGILF